MTRRGKKKHMLTPMTFSLIHATDFADRTEQHIIPPLKAGALVVADRYVYFRISVEEAMKRIVGGRDAINYYEAGMDRQLSGDVEESFRLFQGAIIDEYDRMVNEFGLIVIDASCSIEAQQVQMRQMVTKALAGARKNRIRRWVDLNSMVRASRP